MLSTYKKALKHELVKNGFWAAGERAVGKREFRMFMRYFEEGTFKKYRASLLCGKYTSVTSKHKKFNSFHKEMLSCFTSVDFAHSLKSPKNKSAYYLLRIVVACRKVQEKK